MRSLIENLAGGMVFQIATGPDAEGRRFTYVSPAVWRLHALHAEEVLRDPALLFAQIIEQDRARFFRRESSAFANKSPLDVNVRFRLPSGEVRWRRFVASPRSEIDGSTRWDGIELDVTEEKKTERETVKPSSLLQQILDTASVAIFLVDKGGMITHANKRMTEMFRCPMDELVGSEYVDHIHPSERATGRARMLALLASEISSVDVERYYWRRDGTEFWGNLVGRRFHDTYGNEIGLIGVISDIDNRKQAESTLRESEAKYRRLYNETPVMLHSIDRDARVVEVNDHWLRTLGYERTEVIGRNVTDFYTEASRKYAREVVQPAFFSDGLVKDVAYQFVKKNGEILDVLLSATAERDAEGNVVRSQAISQDITEYKKAEDALRASEARFRDLTESLPLTVFEMNPDGRFTYLNRTATEKLGYSHQELRSGLNLFQVIAQGERDRAREMIARRLEGNAEGYAEYLALRKDGTHFPVTIGSTPILRDGRPAGLRGIIIDLTERKELERERLRAQKLESVGVLAGGIAHDFNNLLQGIFGYISMAKMNLDEKEECLSLLEQAEKALHQSVSLTTQLLTFAKGGKPVKRVIDLKPVIGNAVRLALSGSRSNYCLDIAEDLLAVDADEGQIAQVIQNIVINADQAMPLGGTVLISAKNSSGSERGERSPTGQYVKISIRDTGIGIPEEYLPNIFDPYFTTKEKGSGIGLATTYSIISNHGGFIDVQSKAGEGTTFAVSLPGIPHPGRIAPETRIPPAVRTARLLVMDDDDMVRTLAGEMIRALGHDVTCVSDGTAVIREYIAAREQGRPYDLVILDLTVRGGMGGEEAIAALRERDPGVRAVVSSGYSESAALSEYSERGFCAYLKKPYGATKLKELLTQLLGRGSA